MTATVVVIPQDMSLQGAARRLIESQVSGAPVVDEEGRCVGVISAGDFVFWAGKEKNPKAAPANLGCVCASWQIVEADQLCDESRVRHYMTADPVTVIQSTPVQKLAQMMLDAHIHRLIVVDRQQQPDRHHLQHRYPGRRGSCGEQHCRAKWSKTSLPMCGIDPSVSQALFRRNVMRKIFVALSLVALGLMLVPMGASQAPNRDLARLMKEKLKSAQVLMEGMALADYAKIRRSADELIQLSKTEEWMVYKTPRYQVLQQRIPPGRGDDLPKGEGQEHRRRGPGLCRHDPVLRALP